MTKEMTIYYLAVWVTIATVIKGSVIESNDLFGAETASSSALSSMSGREVIRNCGCLILTPQTSVAGRRYLPLSAGINRNGICNAFCGHLSGSHFATAPSPAECLCFDTKPQASFECEEVEAGDIQSDVILQLKCVEGMGFGENSRVSHPTRRNTISGNVLSFLRLNMPPNRPPPNGGGRGRGEEEADDFLPFEEEVQRRSRHIAPNSGRFDSVKTYVGSTKPVVVSSSASLIESTATFGPSKSAGLAATLILLAFICIFTMGLKTWYHTKRKEQKEKIAKENSKSDTPVPQVKKDIDWEKIMSY